MFNGEALTTLIDTVSKHERLFEDDKKIVFAQAGKRIVVDKLISTRHHRFVSLDGLIDFLNGGWAQDTHGIVFVNDDEVRVDLAYLEPEMNRHEASLHLKNSSEFSMLKMMQGGIGQDELIEALITTLDGCIEPELLYQISNVNIKETKDSTLKIDEVGSRREKGSTDLIISFEDEKGQTKQQPLGTRWRFTGRIWSCFKSEYEIEVTMRVKVKDGKPVFHFFPKRISDVLEAARHDLIAKLDADIQNFDVYEGHLSA